MKFGDVLEISSGEIHSRRRFKKGIHISIHASIDSPPFWFVEVKRQEGKNHFSLIFHNHDDEWWKFTPRFFFIFVKIAFHPRKFELSSFPSNIRTGC